MHALTVPVLVALGSLMLASVTALPMLYTDDLADNNTDLDDSNAAPSLEHLQSLSSHHSGGGGSPIHEESLVEKREPKRYGFGLGRRSAGYTYQTSGSSGVKRLPVYNFGLGKRSDGSATAAARPGQMYESGGRPYMFGLGKRNGAMMDEEADYNELTDSDLQRLAIVYPLPLSYDIEAAELLKRSRPFDFGLGKRLSLSDAISVPRALPRRSSPQRYNFGLGR